MEIGIGWVVLMCGASVVAGWGGCSIFRAGKLADLAAENDGLSKRLAHEADVNGLKTRALQARDREIRRLRAEGERAAAVFKRLGAEHARLQKDHAAQRVRAFTNELNEAEPAAREREDKSCTGSASDSDSAPA